MRFAPEITLARDAAPNGNTAPSSEIMSSSRPTGKRVPGAILEASLRWRDRVLLFTSDDIPFEETLHILLLSEDFAILDAARLSAAYSTGAFRDPRLIQPSSVEFGFFGSTVWRVDLLDRPSLRLPFFSEPRGVHRPFGLSRQFVVRGNPKPQD